MVPTDRQLVDSLLGAILAMSEFTAMILDDEIERVSSGQVINIAQLKALGDARREFQLRALIMEYALKAPGLH
jgi:hypothetical protein